MSRSRGSSGHQRWTKDQLKAVSSRHKHCAQGASNVWLSTAHSSPQRCSLTLHVATVGQGVFWSPQEDFVNQSGRLPGCAAHGHYHRSLTNASFSRICSITMADAMPRKPQLPCRSSQRKTRWLSRWEACTTCPVAITYGFYTNGLSEGVW